VDQLSGLLANGFRALTTAKAASTAANTSIATIDAAES
jgi:hypothetical protein